MNGRTWEQELTRGYIATTVTRQLATITAKGTVGAAAAAIGQRLHTVENVPPTAWASITDQLVKAALNVASPETETHARQQIQHGYDWAAADPSRLKPIPPLPTNPPEPIQHGTIPPANTWTKPNVREWLMEHLTVEGAARLDIIAAAKAAGYGRSNIDAAFAALKADGLARRFLVGKAAYWAKTNPETESIPEKTIAANPAAPRAQAPEGDRAKSEEGATDRTIPESIPEHDSRESIPEDDSKPTEPTVTVVTSEPGAINHGHLLINSRNRPDGIDFANDTPAFTQRLHSPWDDLPDTDTDTDGLPVHKPTCEHRDALPIHGHGLNTCTLCERWHTNRGFPYPCRP